MVIKDESTRLLFGSMPRFAGILNQPSDFARQPWIFSDKHLQMVIDNNNGKNNLYSSFCYYARNGTPIADKISFDLDSTMKDAAFPETEDDDEKISLMREDDDLAGEVLYDVLEDAKVVADYALANNWTMIGVFSGMGMHVHLLCEPVVNPSDEVESTSNMILDELGLTTVDVQCIGDTSRLLRIPNCHRIWDERKCGVYTVPFGAEEVLELSPSNILEKSLEPREADIIDLGRHEIEVQEEYLREVSNGANYSDVENIEWQEIEVDEKLKQYLKDIIKMPCMWQGVLKKEPRHVVRFNTAINLYNCGMTPEDVFNLFESLNWNDWNPKITKKYLEQIYNRKYANMSCESLQAKGHCVFEPEEREAKCPTYKWKGGTAWY